VVSGQWSEKDKTIPHMTPERKCLPYLNRRALKKCGRPSPAWERGYPMSYS